MDKKSIVCFTEINHLYWRNIDGRDFNLLPQKTQESGKDIRIFLQDLELLTNEDINYMR